MKQKNGYLACPKCEHIITNKDLEDWTCTECGQEFKITLEGVKIKKRKN